MATPRDWLNAGRTAIKSAFLADPGLRHELVDKAAAVLLERMDILDKMTWEMVADAIITELFGG